MKRFLVLAAALATAALVAVPNIASAGQSSTGNGAPSGPHFDLNIHGVANGQGFNGNNQNNIFVPLYGKCNIDLQQAATFDFQVLQPDCVNNPPAQFELPAPCAINPTNGLCSSTDTIYSVYARVLSKPGGQSTTTPCFTDTSGSTFCSTNSYVAVRGTGQSKFTNQTSNLLFITQCNNGTSTTVPIFSNPLFQYFWQYDNQGLRLAQLRFYQVPSPVPATTGTC